jgi:hypothetical protein
MKITWRRWIADSYAASHDIRAFVEREGSLGPILRQMNTTSLFKTRSSRGICFNTNLAATRKATNCAHTRKCTYDTSIPSFSPSPPFLRL